MTGTSVTFRASRIGKRNAAMEIKEISNDKKRYLSLLLLADEQEDVIGQRRHVCAG